MRSLVWIWSTPSMRYSIGSSMVMIFLASLLMRSSTALSVVVLPLPVGPVTRTRPLGRAAIATSCGEVSVAQAQLLEGQRGALAAEQPQHEGLAVGDRDHGHPHVHAVVAQVHGDAPVLRAGGAP